MDTLKHVLPTRLFEILEKAGICTTKEIIILSHYDIKKLTNLFDDDIHMLKNIVTYNCSPQSVSGDTLNEDNVTVKIGCTSIDKILNGGFRKGTLTEIYGESGIGKTQIALQTAVYSGMNGCVYICTEDIFPLKRFNQISENICDKNVMNCKKNMFIEHLTESQELLSCVRVRLPKLLKLNNINALIIDSVAAPFRCDNTNYVQRAEELKELAILLLNIAQEYNLAVICINQVSACFDGSDDVIPTLGLVWSNMISCRLKVTRTNEEYRELSVCFAPHLSNELVAKFVITKNGINDFIQ